MVFLKLCLCSQWAITHNERDLILLCDRTPMTVEDKYRLKHCVNFYSLRLALTFFQIAILL